MTSRFKAGRFTAGALALMTVAATLLLPTAAVAAADPCGANSNPIVCENSKPGTPIGDWYAEDSWGDIEGFSTKVSVQAGEQLQLKVQSPSAYKLTIYRLGYYGGDGARLMPTSPTGSFPAKTQAPCLHDTATGLVDCGNWTVNATWQVPTNAVSGVYLAMLDQGNGDGSGFEPYPFVVTNDNSHSDVLVQTSDQTWQAYNTWGGQDVYYGGGPAPDGRAYKVSYNRPLSIAGDNGLLSTEFPMIQWLERNGYDVSYASGLDVSTKPSILLNHKMFMSSGHDEYWNGPQFNNVMAARKAGVNLAFFSGNEAFWRTRYEPSISSDATANRTMVTYKMTKMAMTPPNGIADPSGQWTGTWMDPAGAGTGGNTPQNQLTGTLFTVNGYRDDALTVSSAYKKMRLWRNTTIPNLADGQVATFPTGTLGYEWDSDVSNSVRPTAAVDFSSTTVNITDDTLLLDQGNTYGNGTATHNIVEYRDQTSHALVFGAGTVQWAWGLSAFHSQLASTVDVRMQQATANILSDMGAQPLTLQSNLVMPAKSTDTTGPAITVTSPAAGATIPVLSPTTVTGTATDAGAVGRVEVSTDGGTTWVPATGTSNWSYTWSPTAMGTGQLKIRAVDDSINIGPVTTLSVTVGAQKCPCSAFTPNSVPANVDSNDASANELGAKFRASSAGFVTGVKFYKASLNTGTHVGRLYNSAGKLLASGTFTGESASGWQSLTFANPVAIAANTTYVVSYLAPNGHYSYDSGYFTSKAGGDGMVKELQSGVDGANGVFNAGGAGFPASSWQDTNYWVDAIVDTGTASTTPPTVTAFTPASGATGVALNTSVTATFDHNIDDSTLAFTLSAGGSAIPATVTYDGTSKATLQPNGSLLPSTTYAVSVKASDLTGNAMASAKTWSFTTGSSLNCPCTVLGSSTPAVANATDSTSYEMGMRFTSQLNGYVTGVRFYKGTSNTGTHTGTLWSNTGTQLATGTFTAETASGWQTLKFSTPVAITANTPYVVSYHTSGPYSYTSAYFTQAQSSYPLTGVADTATGHNGLFKASATTAFPDSTWNANNYWVDVVFSTTPN